MGLKNHSQSKFRGAAAPPLDQPLRGDFVRVDKTVKD